MTAAIFARVALAVLFLLAGLSKRRRGTAWFAAVLSDLTIVPPGSAPGLAALVIACELATAVLLLSPAHLVGSALAAALALGFALAVSNQLTAGRRTACGCFGSLVALRIGPGLLAGDLALLGLALSLTASALTPGATFAWYPATLAIVASLSVGGAMQALRVALRRSRGELSPGATVPIAKASTISGGEVRMRELAENVIVLLFVDARCQLCSRLLSSMCTAGPGAVPVLTIVGGHGGTGRRMAERCGCDPEWTVEEPGARRLRSRFRISGVPSVTVLAAGRVVGTCSPASADAVRALLARIRSVA